MTSNRYVLTGVNIAISGLFSNSFICLGTSKCQRAEFRADGVRSTFGWQGSGCSRKPMADIMVCTGLIRALLWYGCYRPYNGFDVLIFGDILISGGFSLESIMVSALSSHRWHKWYFSEGNLLGYSQKVISQPCRYGSVSMDSDSIAFILHGWRKFIHQESENACVFFFSYLIGRCWEKPELTTVTQWPASYGINQTQSLMASLVSIMVETFKSQEKMPTSYFTALSV